MNTALKMKLEEMNRRLNEALDTDLFEESESEFNEFQAEVDSFERELDETLEFRQDHLQLSELKKIVKGTERSVYKSLCLNIG